MGAAGPGHQILHIIRLIHSIKREMEIVGWLASGIVLHFREAGLVANDAKKVLLPDESLSPGSRRAYHTKDGVCMRSLI